MKVHILGIAGTFMGGIALLARELGHEVTGSDANIYPPMSTQLQQAGIRLYEGYTREALIDSSPDQIIIGNVLSRGNPAVEYILDQGLRYCSGPQWLSEHVLYGRHVMAVSGTHGKTTTTSMLAWVLDYAGKQPGFLIGGVPENFGQSARLGSAFFVVEADEYDTAFFDKRSKFIHYRPRTLVINNIEFDHADIFGDISDIIREFSRLVRIVPGTGRIIHKEGDPNIKKVLETGCWTETVTFSTNAGMWQCRPIRPDYSEFAITHTGKQVASVTWELMGRHNAENALAVMAAAGHAGVDALTAVRALGSFKGVKRRLQKLAEVDGVAIYDDFAHHPTAIEVTLEALRARVGHDRIFAVLEPRSNTMKLGVHKQALAAALTGADQVLVYQPDGLGWDLRSALLGLADKSRVYAGTDEIISALGKEVRAGDHVLIMSNGGFQGIQQRLITALRQR